ncbi:putative periplasmic or secreted lipoprotein [Rubidibacter lacunae KORDI 51-2]|uniref:Putative periplasmic or secreted lipoprotein n=1 Tax=Rubidibacter lacunae KORDI 51-2 TaxID=582515 RepID=U5DKB2_9CHRO|nr:type II toxin-antitoxin system HicA family toxin [Rubidibacter lacunae]ERN41357.1 putative periplasmic or secreted lipoprotein [Rubidibacter lacunae KORDI 51-2]
MKSVPGKKLCKILEKRGWVLKKVTGSHHIYEKSGESKIVSVPVHRNRDLKIGTLKSIMNIAQLLEEDLQ